LFNLARLSLNRCVGSSPNGARSGQRLFFWRDVASLADIVVSQPPGDEIRQVLNPLGQLRQQLDGPLSINCFSDSAPAHGLLVPEQ